MFRKATLTAVLVASMVATLGFAGSAQASPGSGNFNNGFRYDNGWNTGRFNSPARTCDSWNNFGHNHGQTFCVYIYDCHCGSWKFYRCCYSYCDAQSVSRSLQCQGYRTFIQVR